MTGCCSCNSPQCKRCNPNMWTWPGHQYRGLPYSQGEAYDGIHPVQHNKIEKLLEDILKELRVMNDEPIQK